MINQRGIIHLLPLILIISIVILAVLVWQGYIKLPGLSKIIQQKPEVATKTEYKNPFKKETQYVNPFETYKNPFVVSK